MLDFLKKRPMLFAATVSSVISVLTLHSEVTLFILSLLITAFIFFLILKRVKGEMVFAVILILAVTVSGFLTTSKINKLEQFDGVVCRGEFAVIERPVNHGEFYSVTLEVIKSDNLNKSEKIKVLYNDVILEYSDKINAEIKLSKFSENQRKYSFYGDGMFLSGYINTSEKVEGENVLTVVESVRKHIKKTVFANFKPREAATVMALVAGDNSYFTPEFDNAVKSAGVAHVMVVSGMHLSVIVSMVLYILNRFFYNPYLKAITILFVTIAVMAVCGFTKSIIRAGITYILMAIALSLKRESTGENTLGGAVLLVLIDNPYAVFSVAFELSVLSTLSILVVANPICEFLAERFISSKVIMSVIASALISISALIFTAPIAIYYFGYISTVSIVTNLLIGTATSYIMIFCILGFAVPFMDSAFFAISELLTGYTNAVINYFGTLPFSTLDCPRWTVAIPIILIIVILLGLVACKVRRDMVKLKEMEIKRIVEGGNGKYAANFGANLKKRSKKRK